MLSPRIFGMACSDSLPDPTIHASSYEAPGMRTSTLRKQASLPDPNNSVLEWAVQAGVRKGLAIPGLG